MSDTENGQRTIPDPQSPQTNLKTCSRCKVTKPVEDFSKSSGGYWCKACRREYAKEWFSAHPDAKKKNADRAKQQYYSKFEQRERAKANRRAWTRDLKMKVLEYYSGTPPKCQCCGESHVEFLTIDHLANGGKIQREEGVRSGEPLYKWIIDNGYPAWFQVLCMNCNFSKGMFGYCPHSGYSERSLRYDPNERR